MHGLDKWLCVLNESILHRLVRRLAVSYDPHTPAEYMRQCLTYAQEVGQRNTFSSSLMNMNVLLGGVAADGRLHFCEAYDKN